MVDEAANNLDENISKEFDYGEGHSVERSTSWWITNIAPHVVGIFTLVAMILFGYIVLDISNSQICFYLILSIPILLLGIGGLISDFDNIRIEINEEGISNPHRSIPEIITKRNNYLHWNSIQKVRFIDHDNVSFKGNDNLSKFTFFIFWDNKMMGFRRRDLKNINETCEFIRRYCNAKGIDIEES